MSIQLIEEDFKTKYEPTDKIGNRRKALFPADDSDSDLGHMSPIHSENSNFSDTAAFNTLENDADLKFRKFFKCNLDDYILLDKDTETNRQFTPDPCSESTMSSLYLSPMQSLLTTPVLYSPMHITQILTPLGKSPSSTLKTPHDTSTVKLNQKQTKRKLPVDTSDMAIAKSPDCKQPKLEPTKSKVRTALFPEPTMPALPVKSFYPKETHSHRFDRILNVKSFPKVFKPRPVPVKKQTSYKKRYGEINAGVRHKIKKPKQKKVKQVKIVKATMNIIEKSPLAEYLEEMTNIKKTINPIPVTNKKQQRKEDETKVVDENDKENTTAILKNRKFFKTVRSTMNKTIETTPLKDVAIENHNNSVTPVVSAEKSKSFQFDGSPSPIQSDINGIIDKLDKDPAILNADLIFSPTSQMCDMASALDLNSPKRAKLNITKMLDEGTYYKRKGLTSSAEKMEKSVKLFPLFSPDANKSLPLTTSLPVKKSGTASQAKKFRNVSENQMLIDAGQKRFGAIECFECKFVYEAGDASDELAHQNYHNASNAFKFNGWKNERVVTNIDMDTKILKIVPGDSKIWWKKANDVLDFINRELGFFDGILPIEKSQVYFYIKSKRIVGCLVAELKQNAHKMLPTDMEIDLCSEESYAIRCGISRLWIAPQHRRSGLASQMLDSLRRNFLHGYILGLHEIAMSSPTDLGKKFATKYFATENFLIYIN